MERLDVAAFFAAGGGAVPTAGAASTAMGAAAFASDAGCSRRGIGSRRGARFTASDAAVFDTASSQMAASPVEATGWSVAAMVVFFGSACTVVVKTAGGEGRRMQNGSEVCFSTA